MQVGDVTVEIGADHVAAVRFGRPPNNFFDVPMIRSLGDAFEALESDPAARAILLCSDGRHFCAGADLSSRETAPLVDAPKPGEETRTNPLYSEGIRLFRGSVPVVAAVQGAAVGGGLGLALMADFRVASPESRFTANFARLGFHHGFGLTVTLPAVVGQQRALELLYTGKRIGGEEAMRIGLCDRLVPADQLLDEARAFAAEIAASAPLAVASIRRTMRGDLPDRIKAATDHENHEQAILRDTDDFREGVKATAERRDPVFTGR